MSGPSLRTLLNVARVWQLDFAEIRVLLGLPTTTELQVWSDAARADQALIVEADILLRISAVLGIYRTFRQLEGSEDEGLKWLRSINREIPFSGRAPLELMLAGCEPGLMDVRGYLFAKEHGGGSAPNEVTATSSLIPTPIYLDLISPRVGDLLCRKTGHSISASSALHE